VPLFFKKKSQIFRGGMNMLACLLTRPLHLGVFCLWGGETVGLVESGRCLLDGGGWV
jgi:hypothetical protein